MASTTTLSVMYVWYICGTYIPRVEFKLKAELDCIEAHCTAMALGQYIIHWNEAYNVGTVVVVGSVGTWSLSVDHAVSCQHNLQ